jgi:hypothetical protein
MSRNQGSLAEFLLYAWIVAPILGVFGGVLLLLAGVNSDWIWWPVLFGVPIALAIGAGVALRRPALEIGAATLASPVFTFVAGLIAFAIVYDSETFQ